MITSVFKLHLSATADIRGRTTGGYPAARATIVSRCIISLSRALHSVTDLEHTSRWPERGTPCHETQSKGDANELVPIGLALRDARINQHLDVLHRAA